VSLSSRRGLALAAAATLVLVAPAVSFAGEHGKPSASGHGNTAPKGDGTGHHHGKKAPRHFTATGVFVSADSSGNTFTMDVKAGSRDLHRVKAVVMTVTSKTKFSRNESAASLSNLVAGDRVSVNGLRGPNGEFDALHVNARSKPAPKPSSTESPEPTASPSESDSPDSSDATPPPSPDPSQSGGSGDSTGGDPTPTPTATP